MAVSVEEVETEFSTGSPARDQTYHLVANRFGHYRQKAERQGVDQFPTLNIIPRARSSEQNNLAHDRSDAVSVDLNSTEQEEEERSTDCGLPVKRAAEVAAAARFISNVDIVTLDAPTCVASQLPLRPRLGSLTNARDSVLDNSQRASKSKSSKSQMQTTSKRSRAARPPPLKLFHTHHDAEEVQTPLPTRTSSKGAPSFDIARCSDSAKASSRTVTSPSLTLEPKTPIAILTPECASAFQFDFSFSTEPSLSRSASDATTDSQLPLTPDADLAEEELQSIEDRIRRDIEAFALEREPFLRSRQQRTRKPAPTEHQNDLQVNQDTSPVLLSAAPSARQEEEKPIVATSPMKTSSTAQDTAAEASPTLRRKKSIFGWLQKEPEVEVDDLIDLYMSEDQKEAGVTTRKASKPKATGLRSRIVRDPSPIDAG